ncbi:MAG TPA: hypothetical protein P5203_14780 [Spirochaetota bacterium]|nr:hypothetical protein [Spirochaetota bacterium]HRT76378.1 hypothetical protein [Spirochaetota bacterium]
MLLKRKQLSSLFTVLTGMALAASCSHLPSPGPVAATPLKSLFELCESDLEKAKKVIIERDLIKMLTHLQKMDRGGDKYYLLEREGITSMIKAVTEGVYSDFVLINREGTVIYTMKNDGIFARNVRTTLGRTALGLCFANRETNPFIASMVSAPLYWDGYYIAVSSQVSAPGTMPGIFILMVDMEKVQHLVGEKSFIIGPAGTYEVAGDRAKIHTAYTDFDRIDLSVPYNDLAVHRFARSSGGSAEYRLFRYSNLRWVIITE